MIMAILIILILVAVLLGALVVFLRSKQIDTLRQRYLTQARARQIELEPRNPWDPGYRREWK